MEKNENGYMKCPNTPDEEGLQLAMVYAPMQTYRMLFSVDEALKHGTLFEELYKPLREVCRD